MAYLATAPAILYHDRAGDGVRATTSTSENSPAMASAATPSNSQ
jgi:hypothetical protein